jgi:peptidyl-prolyl cis-trans isomerase C
MRRWTILAAVLLAAGCKPKTESDAKGAVGANTVLAQVDDMTITSADMKKLLARYSSQPFVLARYSSLERKKELLDSMIRYQVLAIEARKRGYARDPEVQRVAKDKMVKLFTQQEIHDKLKLTDVPDADVEKFYKGHKAEFIRPEIVRVSQILVKDRAKAQKALVAAKALPKSDLKAFRDLVAEVSEDADSRQRGGDLTQFDRATTQHPPVVVDAAFALRNVGDLSDLLSTDKGFVILKLTDRRPALTRTLEEAKPEIQRRLLEDLRTKRKQELVDEARKTIRVDIFEDQLAKLDLDSAIGVPSPPPPQRPGLDAGAVLGIKP